MFKFIHAADIHLDSPLQGLEAHEDAPVAEIRGAARRAFDNLIDLAIDEGVNFVLLAGDLYDGDWRDYNTGLFFIDRMAKLRRAGIRVFLVSGNHDAASQITRSLHLPDNVVPFSVKAPETVRLEDLNIAIHGQGYDRRAVAENLAAQYPQALPHYFNIGLLHTALTGRAGHEPYAPCSADDLRSKGYDYWALGHVHQMEVVRESPFIVFPGNLQGRHIRETGPKGAVLVTVDNGEVTLEHRELDVVRWERCQVDLSACRDIEEVYELVRIAVADLDKADGRIMAVRLELTGRTALHSRLRADSAAMAENFRGLAVGLGVWLEKVKFDTRRPIDLVELEDDSPLAELLKDIDAFELSGGSLPELVPEFNVLKNKLPAELLGGSDAFLADNQELSGMLAEVKELLLARLLRQGGKA